jgi:hypothetical protein
MDFTRRLLMLNGTLLTVLATVGCAITIHADAGPTGRNQDKPYENTRPPAQTFHEMSESTPIFVDWNYKHLRGRDGTSNYPSNVSNYADPGVLLEDFRYNTVNTYVPMPQPDGAHGPGFTGWRSWLVNASMQKVADAGAPVSILIRNRNCPFPYDAQGKPTAPDALRHALDRLPKLDYLFMDLEGEHEKIEQNVHEIIRMVRAHPNPKVADAFIGNYEDFPGERDNALVYPIQRDRTSYYNSGFDRVALYNSGLTVAMPAAYPYEAYSMHTSVGAQQGAENASPNDRAAMLWAPVEKVSIAKRNLPDGHRLVPWVSNYIKYGRPDPHNMYHAAPPPAEDARAVIQHLRLRGANGYVLFTSDNAQTNHPGLSYNQYRTLTLNAWASLDEAFSDEDETVILNLSNDKSSGIVWSGIRSGNKVTVLVSNLSGSSTPVTISLPDIEGLPAKTAPVHNNSHQLFTYEIAADAEISDSTRDDDETPAELTMSQTDDGSGSEQIEAVVEQPKKSRRVFRAKRMVNKR